MWNQWQEIKWCSWCRTGFRHLILRLHYFFIYIFTNTHNWLQSGVGPLAPLLTAAKTKANDHYNSIVIAAGGHSGDLLSRVFLEVPENSGHIFRMTNIVPWLRKYSTWILSLSVGLGCSPGSMTQSEGWKRGVHFVCSAAQRTEPDTEIKTPSTELKASASFSITAVPLTPSFFIPRLFFSLFVNLIWSFLPSELGWLFFVLFPFVVLLKCLFLSNLNH